MTEGTAEERELYELMDACARVSNGKLYALGLEREEIDLSKLAIAVLERNPGPEFFEQEPDDIEKAGCIRRAERNAEIKSRRAAGESTKDIAESLGLTPARVQQILQGRRPSNRIPAPFRAVLARRAYKMRIADAAYTAIAKELGVSEPTARNLVNVGMQLELEGANECRA